MMKRCICSVLFLLALAIPAPQPVSAGSQAVPSTRRMECTVYVTKTGERYHKDGCGYLRYSQAPMTRSEAVRLGYTPCKRCGGSDCER